MKTAISILVCALFVLATGAHAEIFRKNTTVMGTVLEMTLDAPSPVKADEAFQAVEREMVRIEREMSEWREDSPLSEVNRQAGVRPVKVSSELFLVISSARFLGEITGGAFDVTWAAMRGLWDFRAGREKAPKPEEVRSRLGLVDYRDIVLDEEKSTVFLKRKGMALGLGAIAKGYAVDKAMEAATKAGITNAIIKAGGDIRVQGRAAGTSGWEIGIQDPRKKGALIAKLVLTNISISTSGDYERFFIKDGHFYHHIMDPKTGWPAREVRSVTVIGPDTMTTDALSTAIFVLGPEKGLRLAEKLGQVETIIIDAAGLVHATSGMDLKR